MDAFLRRVVAQRELEQEEQLVATPVDSFVRRCRLCGRDINGEGGLSPCLVCTQCGGLKVHFRLLTQDASEAVARCYRSELLRCAGFQPVVPGDAMSDRLCTKCGKRLRANNSSDDCWSCRQGAPESDTAPAGEAPPPAGRRTKADAVKRFKVVAAALGVDPDKLIAEFCEGWLERVRTSAKFGTDA